MAGTVEGLAVREVCLPAGGKEESDSGPGPQLRDEGPRTLARDRSPALTRHQQVPRCPIPLATPDPTTL